MLSYRHRLLSLAVTGLLISGCSLDLGTGSGEEQTLEFDFDEGTAGWIGGISDYPAEQFPNLQFLAGIQSLPPELKIAGNGLYIQSFNTPDDLFTFIKRRLTREDGIRPNQAYGVRYEVLFASRAPSGCLGVGGSPGDSVYLKVGGSGVEPQPTTNENNEVRLNIDKGEQAESGPAASVADTIANGIPCELVTDFNSVPYILLKRVHTHTAPITASEDGELWLLVGQESGFEALTALYFLEISVTIKPFPG